MLCLLLEESECLLNESPHTTTLTAGEVRALADRLTARATSQFLVGQPSQQGDGLLAAGALVHMVVELQAIRAEIERAAASTSDETTARYLRELLAGEGEHDAGVVTVRFED
jgi:hypothetical protein